MCSTPFGINGRNTVFVILETTENLHVLNAFRHQRKEHTEKSGRTTPVPDVLNAFRHQRKEHWKATWWQCTFTIRAQRLSASTEGTLFHRDRATTNPQVLNAFRHQRKEHTSRSTATGRAVGGCSTPFGINGRNTGFESSINRPFVACSTPFGINGRNTALAASTCSLPAYHTTIQALGGSQDDLGPSCPRTPQSLLG